MLRGVDRKSPTRGTLAALTWRSGLLIACVFASVPLGALATSDASAQDAGVSASVIRPGHEGSIRSAVSDFAEDDEPECDVTSIGVQGSRIEFAFHCGDVDHQLFVTPTEPTAEEASAGVVQTAEGRWLRIVPAPSGRMRRLAEGGVSFLESLPSDLYVDPNSPWSEPEATRRMTLARRIALVVLVLLLLGLIVWSRRTQSPSGTP